MFCEDCFVMCRVLAHLLRGNSITVRFDAGEVEDCEEICDHVACFQIWDFDLSKGVNKDMESAWNESNHIGKIKDTLSTLKQVEDLVSVSPVDMTILEDLDMDELRLAIYQ